MPTYTTSARIKKITTGDEEGTWGTSTNTNLDLVDAALSYVSHANADTNETLTISDGAASDARYLFLDITGALTADRTLTVAPNTSQKVWIFRNSTTGGFNIVISQGSGANVTIPAGSTAMVYGDGAGSGAAVGNILATPLVESIALSGTDGIDVNPGSDADADLITVGVTGTPRFWWDESEDSFTSTKDLRIASVGTNAASTVTVGGTQTLTNKTLTSPALGGTVSGTPTWASSQAITLSTAAQANVTSLGTLTSLTVNGAVTVSTANGLDVNPGSDIAADLITVGVTGSPKFAWDETLDRFTLNNDIRVTGDVIASEDCQGSRLLFTADTGSITSGGNPLIMFDDTSGAEHLIIGIGVSLGVGDLNVLSSLTPNFGHLDVAIGRGSQLATTADEGFLLMPGGAGVPTGTPTNYVAGWYPFYYDATNNDIYIYNGSWRSVSVT